LIRIVCDTGPLLHLLEAESLALLGRAGRVYIPPSVQSELLAHHSRWTAERPDWVEIVPLESAFAGEALAWVRSKLLDQGEAEALALCAQLSADWFLTDDTAARMIAQGQDLEVHGSLGIVLWAAATGVLDFIGAKASLAKLARSSLWISARVLGEADAALSRIFE
jgi:predicted nucleic acid-binding protein